MQYMLYEGQSERYSIVRRPFISLIIKDNSLTVDISNVSYCKCLYFCIQKHNPTSRRHPSFQRRPSLFLPGRNAAYETLCTSGCRSAGRRPRPSRRSDHRHKNEKSLGLCAGKRGENKQAKAEVSLHLVNKSGTCRKWHHSSLMTHAI